MVAIITLQKQKERIIKNKSKYLVYVLIFILICFITGKDYIVGKILLFGILK